MKTNTVINCGLAIGLATIITVGCSDVKFSPIAQTDGPLIIDNGKMREETFYFNENRPLSKVDVVFIVDNSTSMYIEGQKMATRLSSFVDSLSAVNWQIGITSTDLSGGKFSTNGALVDMVGTNTKTLTKNTPNYEQVFLNTVTAHGTPIGCDPDFITANTCASGDELPLEAMRQVIEKRDAENSGFFRPGADVVAIVLSDEDENSTGGFGATTGEEVKDAVANAWNGERGLSGYGIIVRPGDSSCWAEQNPHGGEYGDYVKHFADITGGETGSICDNDYGPALASIGRRVLTQATSVRLSAMPVPTTLTVEFIPADPSITWTLVGQTIKLSNLPLPGTRVVIKYEKAD